MPTSSNLHRKSNEYYQALEYLTDAISDTSEIYQEARRRMRYRYPLIVEGQEELEKWEPEAPTPEDGTDPTADPIPAPDYLVVNSDKYWNIECEYRVGVIRELLCDLLKEYGGDSITPSPALRANYEK